MGTLLSEALRMYRRARQVRKGGFHLYRGTPADICKQIIYDAYDQDKKYFRVSSGHFCEFYTRDFAFCCEALVKLGHANEVKNSLIYALNIFQKHGSATTSISPEGIPFNFPAYAPDTLALLLYAITHTHNQALAKEYKEFFSKQVAYFAQQVVDPNTLLPYKSKRFSSIRDHAKRNASCYDAVMIAVVARECKILNIPFPYTEEEIKKKILETYWNGTYFFEDTKRQGIVIGDANVFPFWTGIVTDKKMLSSAITSMQAAGLDQPLPLRYVGPLDKQKEKVSLHTANWFASDYETDSIWLHLGLCYIRILQKQDLAQAANHLDAYEALIIEQRTFLEVLDTHGQPFHTFFYWTDEAMVWCANWLVLTAKNASSEKI